MIRGFPRTLSGAWSKDVESDDDKIYAMLKDEKVSHVREYPSEAALRDNNYTAVHKMPVKCTGTGHLVYKGSVYCNKQHSNRVVKYTLKNKAHSSTRLRDAAFNHSFPYTSGSNTAFDFAADEKGLWVIYASHEHKGNLVTAQLDPDNLQVLHRFVTTFPKTKASNTFMICGRLFVTENNEHGANTIQYIYDTNADKSIPTDDERIHFAGARPQYLNMLDYNSKEQKLYGWRMMGNNWDGQMVTYDVQFAAT